MQRDTSKTVIAAVFSVYFLWCAYDPSNSNLPHFVHLPIHEAGHIFFMILGEFMAVAGGSLFQIIVPLVFFGYFVYHKKPFSAAIVLFWIGSSVSDVYVYAADAQVMQLPMLTGLTGAEGSFHDWNYLLTETNLLNSTSLIARIINFFGIVITVAGVVGSFFYARKGEEILSDFES